MEIATSTRTAARLRRAVTRLSRRLRTSALGGISPAQASMLATIENRECPALGELASAEQIQPPSVTRMVQNLEQAGLVETWQDPDDRRCTRVRLSDTGHHELELIRQRKTEFIERQLLSMTAADQLKAEELVVFLERFLDES